MKSSTKFLVGIGVGLAALLVLAPGGEARTIGALSGNSVNHLFGGCYNSGSDTGCTLASNGAATSNCLTEYWGGVKNACNQYQHWEMFLPIENGGQFQSSINVRGCQPQSSNSLYCYFYSMDSVGSNQETIGPYFFSGSSTTCGNINDNNSADLTVPNLGYLFAVCYMGPNTNVFEVTY
jgi:hypothetical protein